MQITATLTWGALFLWQFEVEKLQSWLGIEPTTLNFSSQSGHSGVHDLTSLGSLNLICSDHYLCLQAQSAPLKEARHCVFDYYYPD